MSFLNQRPQCAVVPADQGGKFAPQFAQEAAREVVIVIGNLDESARTEDYLFAVVCFQVVIIDVGLRWYASEKVNGMSEDRQTVDHDLQGICRPSGFG